MSIKKSFSLIEVLVFITILSIFLITAASIITVSMRQNTLRINMLKATHYNEQLLGWIRDEKEMDWNTFTGNAGNLTYCFNDDAWSTWPSYGPCSSYSLGGMYRRYAVFTTTLSNGIPTQVGVKINTEWLEGGNSFSTKLETLFTIWEQ